ncbi:hypothetical protein C8R45DRAFT_1026847 [Mycena sanguinolenta]|nr:hypothetical protein C8R45DRAFT_1026847 [Mycena sanguinolenta]
MSASQIKDRAFGLAIWKAPAGLSKEAFENKLTAIFDALIALPIAQKKFLKFDLIFRTGLGNEHLNALGLAETQPSVWVRSECATMADYLEILEDPTYANTMREAKNSLSGDHSAVDLFVADVEARVDRPTSKDRTLLVGAVQRPENLSPDAFRQTVANLADKMVSLPISQRILVKHSLWMPNSTIDTQVASLGFSAPKFGAVVMIETEQDAMSEALTDSDTKQFVEDAKRALNIHVGSSVFIANVVNKINK